MVILAKTKLKWVHIFENRSRKRLWSPPFLAMCRNQSILILFNAQVSETNTSKGFPIRNRTSTSLDFWVTKVLRNKKTPCILANITDFKHIFPLKAHEIPKRLLVCLVDCLLYWKLILYIRKDQVKWYNYDNGTKIPVQGHLTAYHTRNHQSQAY